MTSMQFRRLASTREGRAAIGLHPLFDFSFARDAAGAIIMTISQVQLVEPVLYPRDPEPSKIIPARTMPRLGRSRVLH